MTRGTWVTEHNLQPSKLTINDDGLVDGIVLSPMTAGFIATSNSRRACNNTLKKLGYEQPLRRLILKAYVEQVGTPEGWAR